MSMIELDENEIITFDIYFAGIVSMAHCHPGVGRSNGHATASPQKSIEECAELAMKMVEVRRNILTGEGLRRDQWLEDVSQAQLDAER